MNKTSLTLASAIQLTSRLLAGLRSSDAIHRQPVRPDSIQPCKDGSGLTRTNRSRVLVLCLSLTSLYLPALIHAADLPDLEGREIIVVTENAYPPLQFVDPKSGEAMGWEYDAMRELASRLNFKLIIENSSWDAMIPAVSQGQYDIGMTGITIRDDRKEMVDFSDPYMRSEMFMLVRADEERFDSGKTFAALEDGLIGAQAGTTPFYTAVYEVLDGNEQNPRIKLFETFGASIQALRTGDVDLVLTDGTAGSGYVDANPDTFKLVGEAMGSEDFGFIFPKGSDLVAPINAGIEDMKADGTLDQLNTTWFLDYKIGQ